MNTGNPDASHPRRRTPYVRPLWFPDLPTQMIEIEQQAWWDVNDQLRDALARSAQLEAKNRDLQHRWSEMRTELLLRTSGC